MSKPMGYKIWRCRPENNNKEFSDDIFLSREEAEEKIFDLKARPYDPSYVYGIEEIL